MSEPFDETQTVYVSICAFLFFCPELLCLLLIYVFLYLLVSHAVLLSGPQTEPQEGNYSSPGSVRMFCSPANNKLKSSLDRSPVFTSQFYFTAQFAGERRMCVCIKSKTCLHVNTAVNFFNKL